MVYKTVSAFVLNAGLAQVLLDSAAGGVNTATWQNRDWGLRVWG